jgi:acyl-CoA reductase-like NAD-dependent aldehyde dehydrogenase
MYFDKLLIDGEWVSGATSFTVRDKYSGEVLTEVAAASREQVRHAVERARRAFEAGPPGPHERYLVLMRAAEAVAARRAEFRDTIIAESGFTVSDADGAVNRAVQTLTTSAEEAKRLAGEVIPLAGAPGQGNRLGFTIRVPLGVVCAITPFNSPLNTVAHKIAPALAAGNAVVLKPAGATPLTAGLLCEVLRSAGVPAGFLSLLNGAGSELGSWLLAEQTIRFFLFTGSTEVGRRIQGGAGLRRTQMELGSIASTIVCADADVDAALPRILSACFRKAGQVCTSIQLLHVEEPVLARFSERFVGEVRKVQSGDPRLPGTMVGPMISVAEAERVERWVAEAVAQGAKVAVGGPRRRAVVPPVVLTDVKPGMKVVDEEVFGPVVSIVPFERFDDAIARVNASPYGLATGIFTRSLDRAFRAAAALQVGSVHVNETSSSRVDLMPYSGTKDSGFGTEGPKYAVRELTEERLLTIRL